MGKCVMLLINKISGIHDNIHCEISLTNGKEVDEDNQKRNKKNIKEYKQVMLFKNEQK